MNSIDVLAAFDILQEVLNTQKVHLAEAIKEATLQGQLTQAQKILAKAERLEKLIHQVCRLREVWEDLNLKEEDEQLSVTVVRQSVEEFKEVSTSKEYLPELAVADKLFGERRPHKRRRRLPVNKTPEAAYRVPILEALAELNGKGHAREVLEIVYEKMKDQLTEDDHKLLSSGQRRWYNTAHWARYYMVKEGLLRNDSPLGIWEMTEEGWAYLEQAYKGKGEEAS